MLFGEQGALRVEGVVALPARRVDHRVEDDLGAVVEGARAVAAEDHRELLGLDADAAQRPEVVHVEAGGFDLHTDPAVRYLGFGPLADDERVQRAIGVGFLRVHGEHACNLPPH